MGEERQVQGAVLEVGGGPRPELEQLAADAAEVARSSSPEGPDVAGALALARERGDSLPRPGHGATLRLWEALATLGAVDLGVARAVEPHLDALAILDEAAGLKDTPPATAEGGTWGVFAAEGPVGRLRAERAGDSWTLNGPKPWCSLANRLSHALVTAWVDDEQRGLFAVELAAPGVRLDPEGAWPSRGLRAVRSTGLHLDAVPAAAIGAPGWYLDRPGFVWGGIGVASIWYGGAVGLARRLRIAAQQRPPDQLALSHLGAVDAALAGARAALRVAADRVDGPTAEPVTTDAAWLLFWRTRQVVADAAELVLHHVGHALGPAPLAHEEEHARRAADLTVYLRQHHAERDAAALGRAVLQDSNASEACW